MKPILISIKLLTQHSNLKETLKLQTTPHTKEYGTEACWAVLLSCYRFFRKFWISLSSQIVQMFLFLNLSKSFSSVYQVCNQPELVEKSYWNVHLTWTIMLCHAVKETNQCVARWRYCLWGEHSSGQSWSVLSSEWAHEQTSSWETWGFVGHGWALTICTEKQNKTFNPRNLLLRSTKLTHYLPPCQVGLCYLQHSYRSLVDFDKCTTEEFP